MNIDDIANQPWDDRAQISFIYHDCIDYLHDHLPNARRPTDSDVDDLLAHASVMRYCLDAMTNENTTAACTELADAFRTPRDHPDDDLDPLTERLYYFYTDFDSTGLEFRRPNQYDRT